MIGDEIRRARVAAGLTQEELSFRAEVHRTYVSLLERGKRSPTIDVLFRIANAVGVKASVLVARVERAKKRPA
ncbi:helix-turn-helix transcriptional regulator [Candidatus Sumerlaeota bacterium]|nr:helix-turn-helix transcriptional regulator [Candidatus Sumerlaeota bacterium]